MFKAFLSTFIATIITLSSHSLSQENTSANQPAEADSNTRFLDASNKIETVLKTIKDVPGIAVAMYTPEYTLVRGFGISDIDTKEPVTKETAFYIASSTKSITAVAMASLHAKGTIDLDSSLKKFAPDAPFPQNIQPDKITLRHLLAQSSGIINDPISYRVAFTGQHNPTTLWQLLASTENNSENPLGQFQYTNYNYNIFTLLSDKKIGASWKDILHNEIFAKAGMTRTTAYMSTAKSEEWSVARPHIINSKGAKRTYLEKTDTTMQSAGGVIMSANDVAKWLEILVEEGTVDGHRVVPSSAILATRKKAVVVGKTFLGYKREHYGLGFYIGQYGKNKSTMLHHFGSFAGSSAHVSYLPEEKVGVAVFANNDLAGIRLATIISNYLYEVYLNNESADTHFNESVLQLTEQIKKQKGRLKKAEKERAKRQYQLSQPLQKYVGSYTNPLYGTINVSTDASNLAFSMGNLMGTSTPYPKKDTVRVELSPDQGQVISFSFNANDKSDSLVFADITYHKDRFR